MYLNFATLFVVWVQITYGALIRNGTFVSKLNHHDLNSPLISMEYNYMNEYHFAGGPFYIYIKDIDEANSTRWIESGLMAENIVLVTRGTLFTYDHRYFGRNLPVNDLSFENMRYLSIDQILEDIAVFIDHLQTEFRDGQNNIVLWGSGTGATLATRAKVKFPNLVDATWASSGFYTSLSITTNYFYNFIEYGLTMGGTADTRCQQQVVKAFDTLDQLIISSANGDALQSDLNLCTAVDLTSEADVAALFEIYIDFITRFLQEHHTDGVVTFCRAMEIVPNNALRSLVRWVTFIYRADVVCIDHSYQNSVERLSSIIPSPGYQRQLLYLQCTQLGLFKITFGTWLPDRIPLRFHLDRCKDIFGENNIDVDALNEAIELLDADVQNSITNTVFTNGFLDPWLNHGRLSSYGLGENVSVFNIDYQFQSSDLSVLTDRDTLLLRTVKVLIMNFITLWSY